MPFRRKRLVFWLVRAYVRRWLKTILVFFVLGILLATVLLRFLPAIANIQNTKTVGIVGSYTTDTLPLSIQREISRGLTIVKEDGSTTEDLLSSIETSEDGRKYVVVLRNDIFFHDGQQLKASDVNYNFKDARSETVDERSIRFDLSEPFSPFLVSISRPIFKKGLVGVGPYKLRGLKFNGPFIRSLTLEPVDKSKNTRKIYQFYPTEEAVKIAFMLGEVEIIPHIKDPSIFSHWPNLEIEKTYSPYELVTLFFNTKDDVLNSKDIRQALTYALPDTFAGGLSASSPLSYTSYAYLKQPEKFTRNTTRALELLSKEKGKEVMVIHLTSDEKLEEQARAIAKLWEEVGVKTEVQTTKTVPANFQAFLGVFHIPFDPDQYVLWHSTQHTNITGYANQKIDKLLEDGRKTRDHTERERIYSDFQRHLVDEAPAAFLYYPAISTVKRK